jgi:hypothetical protein
VWRSIGTFCLALKLSISIAGLFLGLMDEVVIIYADGETPPPQPDLVLRWAPRHSRHRHTISGARSLVTHLHPLSILHCSGRPLLPFRPPLSLCCPSHSPPPLYLSSRSHCLRLPVCSRHGRSLSPCRSQGKLPLRVALYVHLAVCKVAPQLPTLVGLVADGATKPARVRVGERPPRPRRVRRGRQVPVTREVYHLPAG